jgi:hypothetical protein
MSEKNDPTADVSLTLATPEDMLAELNRRGIRAALVLSHVQGGYYQPSPDLPSQDRECVVGDRFLSDLFHKAWFLCQGVRWCLDDIYDSDVCPNSAERIMKLNRRMLKIREAITLLRPKESD